MLALVPLIDPNKRRGDEVQFEPAKKNVINERIASERINSDLKDNHGEKNIRVIRKQQGFLSSDVWSYRHTCEADA